MTYGAKPEKRILVSVREWCQAGGPGGFVLRWRVFDIHYHVSHEDEHRTYLNAAERAVVLRGLGMKETA